MLFLLFQIREEAYALAATDIVEVLPLVPLRSVPGAPPELAGALRYRGAFVPVVDLARLAGGAATPARLGTRIVVTTIAHRGERRRVGVLAERATDTFAAAPDAFRPFAEGPRGPVLRLDLDRLLPGQARERLLADFATIAA